MSDSVTEPAPPALPDTEPTDAVTLLLNDAEAILRLAQTAHGLWRDGASLLPKLRRLERRIPGEYYVAALGAAVAWALWREERS